MDPYENVDALAAHVSPDTLSDDDLGLLRFAARTAFEFGAFLEGIATVETVSPDAERVGALISKGLDRHYGLRSVVEDYEADIKDKYENIEYVIESAAAGGELYPDFRRLAARIAGDELPIPLQWKVYPSVLELKREYSDHLNVLRSADSSGQQRIRALLHTTRLQLIYFANTFCYAGDCKH
jgi:hypothetical protein